ncbi:MAG: hypothetical protein AAB664_01955 [Patescibacteria group bacterium]
MQQQEPNAIFEYHPDEFGELLIGWEVDEYTEHKRSKLWYVIAGLVSVSLIFYAIATTNFMFAVIILMCCVILMITAFTKPERIPMMITTTGVILGDVYYDYQSIRDFSIVYDPPTVKLLYLDFYAVTHPRLSISLEDADPNVIRNNLLTYCMEDLNRTNEHLTDVVRRLYKL